MFRMNLQQRLMVAMGVIIVAVLALCIMNFSAFEGIKKNFAQMKYWGNVDMIMNEQVIHRFNKLRARLMWWSKEPSPSSMQALRGALKDAEDGLNGWIGLVSARPEFSGTIDGLKSNLQNIKSEISSCFNAQISREKALNYIYENSEKLRSDLGDAMVQVVDPSIKFQ